MNIVLIAALSLDGLITQHQTPGTAFTSAADQTYFADVLQRFDCSVLGANTYRYARERIVQSLTPQRLRVVLSRTRAEEATDALSGQLEFTDRDPLEVVGDLKRRGYQRCALLGGSQIFALFHERDLIDEWWLTFEARVFGSGLPLCPGVWDTHVNLTRVQQIGPNTVLLQYRRKPRAPSLR